MANALHDLLSPVGADEFFRTYWKRKALFLRGDCGLGFAAITLDTVIATLRRRPDARLKAQYFDEDGEHREFELPAGGARLVKHLLSAGMTICIASFDQIEPSVGATSQALARSLGIPGALDVQCYISGRGKGFGLHFDDCPVCVLQCQGSKRWLHAEGPSIPGAPPMNVVADHGGVVSYVQATQRNDIDLPLESELEEHTLTPGDRLFLPAGTWHRAYGDDAVSVAITFSLSPRRLASELSTALARILEHAVPFTPDPPSASIAAPAGPIALNAWTSAGLALMAEKLAHLSAADLARIDASMGSESAREGGAERAEAAAESGEPPGDWDASTVFHRGEPSLAIFTGPDEEGDRALFIYRGKDGVQLPLEVRDAARELLGRESFTLAEASAALSGEPRARALLEALHKIGALKTSIGDSSSRA